MLSREKTKMADLIKSYQSMQVKYSHFFLNYTLSFLHSFILLIQLFQLTPKTLSSKTIVFYKIDFFMDTCMPNKQVQNHRIKDDRIENRIYQFCHLLCSKPLHYEYNISYILLL